MDAFIALYLFLLAIVIAYLVSSKVPSIFQSSLLSASSFINSIVLIGAMIVMGTADTTAQTTIGFIAVVLASANMVGGYVITSRLLQLFNKNNEAGDK